MEWPLQFRHISRIRGTVCMSVRSSTRAYSFRGLPFFRGVLIFSFIIIIYSSLKPNYILCKVIKIIVIVWPLALIIWVQPSAAMSFGWYYSICYDCCCWCFYSDDLFFLLFLAIVYLSRLFGDCQRESENITIRQYIEIRSATDRKFSFLLVFALSFWLAYSRVSIIVANASKENRINIVTYRVYISYVCTRQASESVRMIKTLFRYVRARVCVCVCVSVQKWRETSNNTRLPWLLIQLKLYFFLLLFVRARFSCLAFVFACTFGDFLLCSLSLL